MVITNWKLGLGFSLITAMSWGLLPLALKAVLDVMDPITISWYRFSISAVIAVLWFGLQRTIALKNMLQTRFLPLSLAVSLGLIGNYLLYNWGLSFINPSAIQILIQIAPLLLLAGSVIIFHEKFSARQCFGVVSLGIGLLMFFHLRIDGSVITKDNYLLGVALTIGAAVLWSIYGLAQKQLLKDFQAQDVLLLICLSGTIVLLPLAEPGQLQHLDMIQLLLLAFCGLNTIVAYGCFVLAMTHWQATRVSAVITLAPLMTLLFTVLLNEGLRISVPAEPMDWLSYIGAVLVVAGASVAALSNQEK
ncbi:MAG: DMT family transporter [Halioglobus sp.]|nr:DMT family transporter [Halioglobus sp.]